MREPFVPSEKDQQAARLTVGGVWVEWRFMMIIIVGTLMPMLSHYRYRPAEFIQGLMEKVGWNWFEATYHHDRFILFFIVPMLVIVLLFRENPLKYGLGIGRWREGIVWLVVMSIILAPILWYIVKSNPQMARWYLRRARSDGLGAMVWLQGIELFGWDYIWRGFWLFGLARYVGPGRAILIQMVPFALLHIGKPEVETLSTLFGGTGFGFIAWRCQSFYYAWILHWLVLVATILLAVHYAGTG